MMLHRLDFFSKTYMISLCLERLLNQFLNEFDDGASTVYLRKLIDWFVTQDLKDDCLTVFLHGTLRKVHWSFLL